MTIRVLVVDDSGFFRRRVTEILSQDSHIQVIGSAANGAEAVEKVAQLKPDVVTMDIEMPIMDGITAVRRIMASYPTPVLMFSSLTTEGAQATLDALDAGAVDFLPKKFEDLSLDREEANRVLCARIRAIGARGATSSQAARLQPPMLLGSRDKEGVKSVENKSMPGAVSGMPRTFPYKLVVIGTSTGGPIALQQVLTRLPADFPVPLLLVQHMPATFTPAFAQRLDKLCSITVKEAQDGDSLLPGVALLAPGGKQMVLDRQGARARVRVQDSEPGQNYKPCVDVTFASVAKHFSGQVLGVILTGMGADGREGARLLKQGGSTIWAQDERSCVVYGMPMAVAEAGLADRILSLPDIGASLASGGC
ncbi:MAG: chemotaxis response regulator protein-glutamate methylesterase [Gammaproteobacteria bacterium]|nr:chemotaxis response regulator protein-glutamate methylesterase [Gammaproteobacteria bacterium]